MYQKNLGRQLWAILSPILAYNVVAFLVQFVFMGVHYIQNLDRIAALDAPAEEVRLALFEIMSEVLVYSVEMMGITALLSVPLLLFMIKRDRKREIAMGIVQNKKAPLTKYILIAGISIPFALGLNNIILLSDLVSHSEAYQETAEVFYGAQLLVQIICLGILTPMAEELIFRGLIFRRMRAVMKNPKKAIVFSGLLFGFYHGNMVQIIYACLCGFLLAYIYEKYGSIKAPILAHIIMNLVAIALTEANVFTWIFDNIMRMGLITVACAALASTVFLFIQKIDEKPLKIEEN